MSVQAPINHFITDFYKPGETDFEFYQPTLEDFEAQNMVIPRFKATLLKVLEKVCYVALIAIVATAFAVSYNLLTIPALAPWMVTGLILTSPLLVIAGTTLAQLSHTYSEFAEREDKVYSKLTEIQKWGFDDIKKFFEDHKLNIEKPKEALTQIHPKDPYKLLLPLIARYKAMEEEINATWKYTREAPAKLEKEFQEEKSLDPQVKRKILYENFSMLQSLQEHKIIPQAFQAATLLHIMENPALINIDIVPDSLPIPGVGKCLPISLSERIFAKQKGPTYDAYFVFDSDPAREPITTQDIGDEPNPAKLRKMLFPEQLSHK